MQTVPVCYPHAQINLLSGKGKTDRKSRTANNGNFTEATAAEINHDLVCAFTEVSAVDKPNLTVLKSCMMVSRSSIMVLCFGRDL